MKKPLTDEELREWVATIETNAPSWINMPSLDNGCEEHIEVVVERRVEAIEFSKRVLATINELRTERASARFFGLIFTAIATVLTVVSVAHCQTFPSADQVFLPSAIHISAPWAMYASSLLVKNESGDPISVSCRYASANGAPVVIEKPNAIKIGPRDQAYIDDFLGPVKDSTHGLMGVASGFGQVIFNACLDGADCTGADHSGYRPISVHSRIYSYATPAGLTGCFGGCPHGPEVGQNMNGVPWWGYGDSRHPLQITGIEVAGVVNPADRVRTNIGLVNPWEVPVTLTVTLFDGASHGQRDQVQVTLRPMESTQQPVTQLFPALGAFVKANPTRAITNASITISSSGFDDAFLAYGSRIDAQSGDPTTLEATFITPLPDQAIAAAFEQPVEGQAASASVRFVAAKTASVTPALTPVQKLAMDWAFGQHLKVEMYKSGVKARMLELMDGQRSVAEPKNVSEVR